ncbi:DUF2306 domain-containing protein [Thermopolyspora sp. NPDC052614]|uniref:DUF2306 domain-containing protein n=1 Tax=Thermopolyspora sp. NPDC052614 TaxID=3155682 RepID=UPI00342ADA4A
MIDESTHPRPRRTRNEPAAWRGRFVITGLLALGFVPLLAAGIRLTELSVGAEVTPANARFSASPVPIVLHVVGATVYTVLGAFQFSPRFRRMRSRWHRIAGRILIPTGLVAALSGIWMTLFYRLPAHDGPLLGAFRLLFGTLMTLAIVLGFAAVRRRDIARHRAWMMRAYAIGAGAGTQAVILGSAVAGGIDVDDAHTRALLMGAAWLLNLAVAEVAILRTRTARRTRRVAPHVGS